MLQRVVEDERQPSVLPRRRAAAASLQAPRRSRWSLLTRKLAGLRELSTELTREPRSHSRATR
jgi:hypothetical protein